MTWQAPKGVLVMQRRASSPEWLEPSEHVPERCNYIDSFPTRPSRQWLPRRAANPQSCTPPLRLQSPPFAPLSLVALETPYLLILSHPPNLHLKLPPNLTQTPRRCEVRRTLR